MCLVYELFIGHTQCAFFLQFKEWTLFDLCLDAIVLNNCVLDIGIWHSVTHLKPLNTLIHFTYVSSLSKNVNIVNWSHSLLQSLTHDLSLLTHLSLPLSMGEYYSCCACYLESANKKLVFGHANTVLHSLMTHFDQWLCHDTHSLC